jgi:hypothetical protein
MAILAASTAKQNIALHQHSGRIFVTEPTLKFAFQLQQAIGSLSLHLLLRTYFATSFIVLSLLFAAKTIAFQWYLASRYAALKTSLVLRSVCWAVWGSRTAKRLRKRLEREFFLLILSPGGNSLFLLLFWPGWLVIAATVWYFSIWTR